MCFCTFLCIGVQKKADFTAPAFKEDYKINLL